MVGLGVCVLVAVWVLHAAASHNGLTNRGVIASCPTLQIRNVEDGVFQDVVVCGQVQPEFSTENVTLYAPHFNYPYPTIYFRWWDSSTGNTSTEYQYLSDRVVVSSKSNTVGVSDFTASVDLPLSGTVPKTPTTFSATVACSARATVGLNLYFTFATDNSSSLAGEGIGLSGVNVHSVEFIFTWECYQPSCTSYCSAHGECNDLLGWCDCEEPWAGVSCGLQFSMETTICPQDQFNMTFFVPANLYDLMLPALWAWYTIFHGDRILDWRYLYSWSKLHDVGERIDSDIDVKGQHVLPAFFPPGDYYIVLTTVKTTNIDLTLLQSALHVKDWLSCGAENATCGSTRANQCGLSQGHGYCVNSECVCALGRFWYDCSRGCSGHVVVEESSGTIQSDYPPEGMAMTYVANVYCSWLISPKGDFDAITLTFPSLYIEESDVLSVRLSDENGTYGAVVGLLNGYGSLPLTIYSKHVLLVFITDYATAGNGFIVEYRTTKSKSDLVYWLPPTLGSLLIIVILLSIALFLIRRLKKMAKVNDELQEQNVHLQSVLGQRVSPGDLLSTPAESVVRALESLKEYVSPRQSHTLAYAIGIITSRKMYSVDYSNVTELESDIKDYLYDQVLTKTSVPILSTPALVQGSLALQQGEPNQALIQQIESWDFCPLGIEGPLLAQASSYLFNKSGVLQSLAISPTHLHNYIYAADQSYITTPYHNKNHACDVLQAMNWFLTKCGSVLQLTPMEHFAALFSAVVHDIQHPGVNNNFLIATKSKLSMTYNDISILENFHASTAFQLLEQPDMNFTASFSKEMFREFRTLVINLVLATDMSRHVELLGMWKSSTATAENSLKFTDSTSRLLALKLFIKCADLANSARNWTICEKWAHCVVEEFLSQGDKERSAGLPVSPFMKRDDCNVPKMQSAFNEFVVGPLYDSMYKVFPELEEPVQNLHHNLHSWGSGSTTPKSVKPTNSSKV
ncbi:3'5'-cyclic nucleotide phosphodiesterase family protein [Pelomyxa schiedti]|nr:3'5'-cyclic nucleotide phosphodiesterase family protein [Pelomyxa schiedti]